MPKPTNPNSRKQNEPPNIFRIEQRLPFLLDNFNDSPTSHSIPTEQRRIKAFPDLPDFSASDSEGERSADTDGEEEEEEEYYSSEDERVEGNESTFRLSFKRFDMNQTSPRHEQNGDEDKGSQYVSLHLHKQTPFISFTYPAIPRYRDATYTAPHHTFTLYKQSIFPRHLIHSHSLLPIHLIRGLQNVQLKLFPPTEFFYWTLIMSGGGHFAAAVFDNRTGEIVVHKTFHRYITRRGQGGVQSALDQSKGNAKSAGATIRRYNEAALEKVALYEKER
jgi:hypothetical protein